MIISFKFLLKALLEHYAQMFLKHFQMKVCIFLEWEYFRVR